MQGVDWVCLRHDYGDQVSSQRKNCRGSSKTHSAAKQTIRDEAIRQKKKREKWAQQGRSHRDGGDAAVEVARTARDIAKDSLLAIGEASGARDWAPRNMG